MFQGDEFRRNPGEAVSQGKRYGQPVWSVNRQAWAHPWPADQDQPQRIQTTEIRTCRGIMFWGDSDFYSLSKREEISRLVQFPARRGTCGSGLAWLVVNGKWWVECSMAEDWMFLSRRTPGDTRSGSLKQNIQACGTLDETREVNAAGTLPSQEHQPVSPSQEHRQVRKLAKTGTSSPGTSCHCKLGLSCGCMCKFSLIGYCTSCNTQKM